MVFLRNKGSPPEKLMVGEGVGDVGRMKKGLQQILLFGGWWWWWRRRRRRRFNDCTITVTVVVVIVGLLLLEGVDSIEIEDIRRRSRRLLGNEMKIVIIIVVSIEVVNVRSCG